MTNIPSHNRRFVLKTRPAELPSNENFSIERLPVFPPTDGNLLVRILCVALSPWQNQRLKDFKNYTKPFEIGELIDCDVIGQIISGEAGDFCPGKLVTGRLGWQEIASASPADLQLVSNDFEETLWLTALSSPGLTAYCAMDLFGRPMPGQTLVVTSAAGSVGSFAIQLGVIAGMHVIGIAGTKEKCDIVRDELGAHACLNYKDPLFSEKLASACPGGIDLFFDTLGGEIADTVFDNLAKYATVLIVGRTNSNNSGTPHLDYVNMRQLWAKEARIHCFSRYSYPERWAFAREKMMTLCRDVKIKEIKTIVHGFENTPTALRDMLSGKALGKTIVKYAESER